MCQAKSVGTSEHPSGCVCSTVCLIREHPENCGCRLCTQEKLRLHLNGFLDTLFRLDEMNRTPPPGKEYGLRGWPPHH